MRFRRGPGRNWEGRSWVTSPSVNALMDEIEAAFPARHPADGTVASRGHDYNNPSSDHRPYPYTGPGVVNAVDSGGRDDGFILTEALRSSRDPRIKYVIFDSRIFSSYSRPGRDPWEWGDYSGASHASHVHVSVLRSNQNNGDPWNLDLGDMAILSDDEQRELQAFLNFIREKDSNVGFVNQCIDDIREKNAAGGAYAPRDHSHGGNGGLSEAQVKAIINDSQIVAPE